MDTYIAFMPWLLWIVHWHAYILSDHIFIYNLLVFNVKVYFRSMKTENSQMYQLDFKEAEEPEIKLPAFTTSERKQENSRKTSTSVSLTTIKSFTMWIITNYRKLLRRLACLLRNLYACSEATVRHYMEQLTGSKLGKEYNKAVYSHPVYLTYIQSTSCKIPGWMSYKLESRLPGKISTVSDMQMIPL